VFNKYYRKIDDVVIRDPLKHPIWGAMLWMVLEFIYKCMFISQMRNSYC